jgi:hypothetical protein
VVLVVAGAVLVTALAIAAVAVLGQKRPAEPPAAAGRARTHASDSAPPGLAADERARVKAERQRWQRPEKEREVAPRNASAGKALADDYRRKVDDLLEKAKRARRGLNDSKRLTPQASAALSQIETRLASIRNSVGVLEGATNDESRRLARVAIDSMLAGVRRKFVELRQ